MHFYLLGSFCASLFLWLYPGITAASSTHSKCDTSSFPLPELVGAQIDSLTAVHVSNYSVFVPQNGAGPYFDTDYTGLSFCNVTITYTYLSSETDFSVRTTVWLPMEHWNGRFQGTGGSGFSSGLGSLGLAPAVANGYAAAETDGGHSETDADPGTWALNSHGVVDGPRFLSFASTSLNDLSILGKAVTKAFYGVAPAFSYWNGCSTGGRQGLQLAQRYPTAFDGIAALSPAINWPSLTVSTYWPQQIMNRLQHYPHQCELAYITSQAIRVCDSEDGVADGILSLPGLCTFDAESAVGDIVDCDGVNKTISTTTATIANAAWAGNGVWYGLTRGTPLEGMANTTCTSSVETSCTGIPFSIEPWIPYFVEEDPEFPIANMTMQEYYAVFEESNLKYQNSIGTADPDLSFFHAAGGKMITTHGLADPAIFPNGTFQYYEKVLAFDSHAQEYYRLFEAPGIGHCGSPGTGSYYPNNTFEALIKWVEHGQAPDTLTGVYQDDSTLVRPLCLYPKEQHYSGPDSNGDPVFQCV